MIKRFLLPATAAVLAAMALLAAGSLVGLGVTSWGKENKADFQWLPFATNSQDQQSWLSWNMPPPIEFQSHADCMARVGQFLSSDYNSHEGFKPPYGCVFHGNNYYYVYLINWLYDGSTFAGCLGKRIASSADSSSDPLYDPALIGAAEAGPTWYCVGWWTDPVLLRSQAHARQVAACQHHNSGWEYVAEFALAEHISRFNERCAELGVKTNCKLVQDAPVPAPPNETEGQRADREALNELSPVRQECSDQRQDADGSHYD
jgi:hypothetical protein